MGIEVKKTVERRKKGPGKFWLYSLSGDTKVPQAQVEDQAREVIKQCKGFIPANLPADYLECDRERDVLLFSEIRLRSVDGSQPLYDIVQAWKKAQMRDMELEKRIQMTLFVIIWCFDDENTQEILKKAKNKASGFKKLIEGLYGEFRDECIPKVSSLLLRYFPFETSSLEAIRHDLLTVYENEIAPKIKNLSVPLQMLFIEELLSTEAGSLLAEIHDHQSNAQAIINRITDEARKQLEALPNPVKEA